MVRSGIWANDDGSPMTLRQMFSDTVTADDIRPMVTNSRAAPAKPTKERR